MVWWTAFYRLIAFSAVSRISASFKASVTVLQVAGEAFRKKICCMLKGSLKQFLAPALIVPDSFRRS